MAAAALRDVDLDTPFATDGGSLSILNAGEGDIAITFNKDDATDADRAIKMLVDMQKRGYGIFVRMEDGTYARAESIDASRGVYVVTLPDLVTEPSDEKAPAKAKRGGRRGRRKEMPVTRTHAVGVARSAGG